MESKKTISFDELLEGLRCYFAEDRVNIDEVKSFMESYHSCYEDWKKYAFFDKHKYTRNLVDQGNGKFNLILLCWSEGQGSSIHDHSDSHCFMKVMEGQLKETLFDWPKSDETLDEKLHGIGINYYTTDSVTYINDSIGLHRVENESHTSKAVSLHLYSPPFDMCQCFDERTSHRRKCSVTFYSEMGNKTKIEKKQQ